jgi:DNA-binding PadR family transcriptional regulator
VDGDAPDSRLPLTSYATLGLLSPGGEFTAVEIEDRAHEYLRFFYWAPALSHIRRELNRLEELGYVSGREVPRGRLNRTLKYRLTPEGTRALKAWAEGSEIEPAVKKNPAILRLWLGRRGADPAAVVNVLKSHLEYVESERRSLLDFIRTTESVYRDRLAEVNAGTSEPDPETSASLARWAWHAAVMRYCLRDFDAEVKNLKQLDGDLKALLTEYPHTMPAE